MSGWSMHLRQRQAAPEERPTRQFLTLTLGSELFALPIEHIREIIEFGGLTGIPLMPAFLRGVINLRGAVVPVIDLALRFGRARTAIARRTCIVIVEALRGDGPRLIGVMVDAVSEVLAVESHRFESRPSFGASVRAEFIAGILEHDGQFVVVLDVSRALSLDELDAALDPAVPR